MAKIDVGDTAPDFTLEGHRWILHPLRAARQARRAPLLPRRRHDGLHEAVLQRTATGPRTSPRSTPCSSGSLPRERTSKESFVAKHGLTTPLLADDDGAVSEAYGIYSKRLGVTKRSVFIVDEDGKIAHKHGNFLSLTFDSVDDIKDALERLPTRV